MKLRRWILSIAALCVLLASCRLPPDAPLEGIGRLPPSASTVGAGTSAPDRLSYGMPVSEGPAYEAVDDGTSAEIDLTDLNASALYARVGIMNASPEEYVGSTVRMAGLFSSEETKTGRRFYCSVPDAAGCCLESFEFRRAEDAVYPDGYPEEGTVVTVCGVFRSERVNEYFSYAFLEDARLLWK